jgi:hypothetical protein
MEVRFHGFEDGKDFNDRGGVLKKQGDTLVIDQSIPTEQAGATVEELTAKKAEADARLNLLIQQIKVGTASAQETAELSSVAAEARQLALDLDAAQRAADEQKAASAARLDQERRQRFDELMLQAKEQRTKFAQLYRETCLALGQFCASVDEARALANAMATQLGMWPQHSNAVREMSENPNPLPSLLESGFRQTNAWGWNLGISVVPLHPLGEKQ